MDTVSSSPIKRRAALAALDANAMPTMMSSPMGSNKLMLTPSALLRSSPLKDTPVGRKRAAEDDGSPIVKKTCVDVQSTRSRSQSPDASSMFDSSAGDASWATTATEPDLVGRIPVTRLRALTREQAREKAEILRLRLGLASYKVRTGQTTIPLSELQRKPLPPRRMHARIHSVDSTRVQLPTPQRRHHPHQSSQESVETNANTATSEEPENGESDVERTRGLIPAAAAAVAAAGMLRPSPLLQDGGGVLIAGRAAGGRLGLRRLDG